MSEDMDRPDLSITVKRDSGDYEIKMTYGLEMDLRRVMPDPSSAIQLAMLEPDTQDYIIRRCLTPTKKAISDASQLTAVEDIDIDTEAGNDIILWALEHQLYFFAKRARAMMKIAERQQTEVPPNLTTPGSEDSNSTTPAAGPSTSSKETSPPSSGDTPEES